MGKLPPGKFVAVLPSPRPLAHPLPKPTPPVPIEEQGGIGVCWCLTMTYFHTGTRTIIGAKLFHGPVREGKGWCQLAVVIRRKGRLHARGVCVQPDSQSRVFGI